MNNLHSISKCLFIVSFDFLILYNSCWEYSISNCLWIPVPPTKTGTLLYVLPFNTDKVISLFVLLKNFDYPEKPLKYKHIRRISDWFYYQFTTFNGLRLDMPEHLASMKQPNTNATHWRRGTSAITQFHIAPHWRRYLIPTGKQGTPLFFYPHVTQ